MPEFPKTRIQIVKKKELELKVNQYSIEINKYKHELREINSNI